MTAVSDVRQRRCRALRHKVEYLCAKNGLTSEQDHTIAKLGVQHAVNHTLCNHIGVNKDLRNKLLALLLPCGIVLRHRK